MRHSSVRVGLCIVFALLIKMAFAAPKLTKVRPEFTQSFNEEVLEWRRKSSNICVLLADRTLHCFVDPQGLTITSTLLAPEPLNIVQDVADWDMAMDQICALGFNHELRCWGNGRMRSGPRGSCGVYPASLDPATSLMHQGDFMCVRRDGEVTCSACMNGGISLQSKIPLLLPTAPTFWLTQESFCQEIDEQSLVCYTGFAGLSQQAIVEYSSVQGRPAASASFDEISLAMAPLASPFFVARPPFNDFAHYVLATEPTHFNDRPHWVFDRLGYESQPYEPQVWAGDHPMRHAPEDKPICWLGSDRRVIECLSNEEASR